MDYIFRQPFTRQAGIKKNSLIPLDFHIDKVT